MLGEIQMTVRYWIGVLNFSHVKRGLAGGFAQLSHGKAAALKRMGVGDWLIYYSPKTEMTEGEPLQKFTAIGRVKGADVYEFKMSEEFTPFRREIEYLECTPTKQSSSSNFKEAQAGLSVIARRSKS